MNRLGILRTGFVLSVFFFLQLGCQAQEILPQKETKPVPKPKPEPTNVEIQVVDESTKRGVPLVELETVNHIRFFTDSAGRVAITDPGLLNREVFFHIRSHGYEFQKDGFGYRGKRFELTPGKSYKVSIKRLNLAERLYRITGGGIYNDSVVLKKVVPIKDPLLNAQVVGQDSAFAVPYQDKIYWFWGDTSRHSYPLGHFWMAGATSSLPNSGGLDPSVGIDLKYFTDEKGFSKPMCRLNVKKGLMWSDAFVTLKDQTGKEKLVCHYAHMESLSKMLGHGLAVYDDEKEEFVRLQSLDLKSLWRWPGQAHPVRYKSEGKEYLLLGEVFPTSRVPANYESFTDLKQYEAWTCLEDATIKDDLKVLRDSKGELIWRWSVDAPPVDAKLEGQLLAQRKILPSEARYTPVDVDSGKPIFLARGSVNWNAYRKRWVMIATQLGGDSNLGEIWYSEAKEPTGPWLRAKKIVTHKNYSFYNPVHHAFMDQKKGRLIYFEGTYVNTFSGNPVATPRYNYNQIMYRLDLSDERLVKAFTSAN